jgi:hypothetical protein
MLTKRNKLMLKSLPSIRLGSLAISVTAILLAVEWCIWNYR